MEIIVEKFYSLTKKERRHLQDMAIVNTNDLMTQFNWIKDKPDACRICNQIKDKLVKEE
jgi:hypothetical protein